MRTLFINGKFLAQRVTGVQRLAGGLVLALDRLLARTGTDDRWVLLCPPGAAVPRLERIEVRHVGPRVGGLHLWEQLVLPVVTAGRTLLNLAGPAPLLKRNQVCMIPDAAVFDQPQAYTRAFGTWYRLLFRSASRSARLLLTISEFSKRQLTAALGSRARPLHVVYCAASHMQDVRPDPAVLERLGLSGKPYLLAVGSLNPTKNLAALTAAFLALADDELRLVLVGGSNAAVFSGATPHPIEDHRILSTGPIDDAQLTALYAGALAFVFPSLYEGFGLPPLEAMSFGCPVVSSNAASMPEICGDAALYFDPTSVPDISRALAQITADPSLRDGLRQRGDSRVTLFTWDNAARQLFSHLARTDLVTRRPL